MVENLQFNIRRKIYEIVANLLIANCVSRVEMLKI